MRDSSNLVSIRLCNCSELNYSNTKPRVPHPLQTCEYVQIILNFLCSAFDMLDTFPNETQDIDSFLIAFYDNTK